MENPYLQMLQRAIQRSSMSDMTTNEPSLSLDEYGLGGVNCDKCNNTGYITTERNGALYSRPCECMKKRRSMRRIRNSGMSDMLERYSFGKFETPDEERSNLKARALVFADRDEGWLYISGTSGSGKTHICTAICKRLIDREQEVLYMLWRDMSRQLKALVNTEEIEPLLRKLKTVQILYIDDFFKGSSSDADIRMAFEIINSRYNDSHLRTIISSEYGLEDILSMDEALGGRIYERSKGFRLKAPSENWRLRE